MPTININRKELMGFVKTLEKLHKSALPIAVRSSLNDAAFAMMKKTPTIFEKNFIVRKKTFLRSSSTVNKCANTFNISEMKAEYGIIRKKSTAATNLEKQEFGGNIGKRDYIPFKEARVSRNAAKIISKKYHLKNVKPQKNKNIFKNSELIKTAFAIGQGGFIQYDNVIFEIRTLKKPFFMKLIPLYSVKKGRSVKIKRKPFILPAAEMISKRMPIYFKNQAEKQFQKYIK